MARTPDTTVHVAWVRDGQLTYSAPGAGFTVPIAAAADAPALVAFGDELRAFSGNVTAVSVDGGASWQVGANSASGAVSAAALADGGSLVAWEAGGRVKAGSVDYGPGAFPAVAADATVAWFADGVRVRSAGGEAVAMPDTADLPAGRPSLVSVAGRTVVAFRDQVWVVGARSTLPLEGATVSGVAADARGRVWVTWTDGARVYAARSDRDVSQLGEPVDLGALPATRVQVSATNTAAHVLAAANGVSYLRRTLPGLALDERHRREIFTFSVTDAGEPVRGAVVKVGGRSGKTDRNGRVTLRVSKRKATVTATLKGYEKARLTLK